MSDNKKYYYLKLKEGFFDSDEIIALESLPDGILFSNILLKMYLRSLKHDGRLMLTDRIPYNPTVIASIVRQPVAVVEKAIAAFEELGLVEILDNGAIYMLDIQNFIGESSSEADRKRSYRNRIAEEKNALLGQSVGQSEGQTVGQMSQQMSDQSSDKNPPEIRDKRLNNIYIYAPAISMMKSEYQKLVDLAKDEALVKEVIECASVWKLEPRNKAKASRIKNNYLFLRNWIKRELEKKQPPQQNDDNFDVVWNEVMRRIKGPWSDKGWSSPVVLATVRAIGFSKLQQCSSYDLEKMKKAFYYAYKERLNG